MYLPSCQQVYTDPHRYINTHTESVSSIVQSSPSGWERGESVPYGGSVGQLNGGGNLYLPDYSVRQLTPLQIIKVGTFAMIPSTHILKYPQYYVCQITRSHYQNAVTATRMDTSPQTPDVDAHLTGGNRLSPETRDALAGSHHTTTLAPPPREPSRPRSARSRPQQSCVTHSTSLLNEKNRIVREYLQTKQEVISQSSFFPLLLFYHVKRKQQVL